MDKPMDEFTIIARLTNRLTAPMDGVQVGIGDDAAVISLSTGVDLLISTDTLVEGVHFSSTTMDDAAIGYKAIAVSISDIAAMGGLPQSVVLAITVPPQLAVASLEAMYDGVNRACTEFQCPMVGGNLSRTDGPLVITSTVTGTVPQGGAVLRSGAAPGDVVFVTGAVGGSGAGLAYLQQSGVVAPDEATTLTLFHRYPRPQVRAGQVLREAGATSLNDVSDGLASELNEIADASGVRIRIDAGRIPMASAVRNFAHRRREDPLQYAWYGGEDYQLVGTAPSFGFARALALCESEGIKLTKIGRVEAGDGVVADVDGRLEVIRPRGYNHFRTGE